MLQWSFLRVKTDEIPPCGARSESHWIVTLRVMPMDHARGPPLTQIAVFGYRRFGSGSLLRITRPGSLASPEGAASLVCPPGPELPVPASSSEPPRTHQPHPQLRLSRPRLRTPAWAGAPRSLRGGGIGAAGPSCLRWVCLCQCLRFCRLDYVSHRTWGS